MHTPLLPRILQVADNRKEDMLKNTSPEYVDELSKDLLKWHSAADRGVLRYVARMQGGSERCWLIP